MVLLRYGGVRSFQRALPFFVGLILGDVAGRALASFVSLALGLNLIGGLFGWGMGTGGG